MLEISPAKGRSGGIFRAHLIHSIEADCCWEVGIKGKMQRPAYLSFAATHDEARAFTANLRKGRKATCFDGFGHEDGKLEILRSGGFKWKSTRIGDATICEVYVPRALALDTGPVDEQGAPFLFMPTVSWVDRQVAGGHQRDVAVASLFSAFLDRRTDLPILRDPSFHRHLYQCALGAPWFQVDPGEPCKWSSSCFTARGDGTKFETLALVEVSTEDLNGFIVDAMSTFQEFQNGPTRKPSQGRLLPNARRSARADIKPRRVA